MPPKRRKTRDEATPEKPKKSRTKKLKTEEKAPQPESKADVELDYTVDDVELDNNHVSDEEPDDSDMPALDNINNIKERYEYKPIITKEIVILHPDNRCTPDTMTAFEQTNIISQRATQINNGGICFTDITGLTDPIEMVKKELRDKKCPLIVRRRVTNGIYEDWSANELGL